jgi:uncharacterized protein
MKHLTKPFYLAIGWLCVGLGIIGIILPFLPTTPFLIVALWAFSRSSPALAQKLRDNPTFGPYLRDWQDHGVIPPSAKIFAVVAMGFSFVCFALFAAMPIAIVVLFAIALLAIATFVVTRPGSPPEQR